MTGRSFVYRKQGGARGLYGGKTGGGAGDTCLGSWIGDLDLGLVGVQGAWWKN